MIPNLCYNRFFCLIFRKGKWRQDSLDSAYDDDPLQLDKNDPLYVDDDVDSSYILTSVDSSKDKSGYDPIVSRAVIGPMFTLAEFKIRVTQSLREYFDSGDASEFILSVQELKCKEYHSDIVKRAISLSCDEGPRERELTSRLLTCIHPSLLSDEEMEAGFDQLLNSLDDLEIDIPDAKGMVGAFLARSMVDEVLPPAYLSSKTFDENSVLDVALKLLSREHCAARLEKVWGPGDGRPVEELKVVMDQLLKVIFECDIVKSIDYHHFRFNSLQLSFSRNIFYLVNLMKRLVVLENSMLHTSIMNLSNVE